LGSPLAQGQDPEEVVALDKRETSVGEGYFVRFWWVCKRKECCLRKGKGPYYCWTEGHVLPYRQPPSESLSTSPRRHPVPAQISPTYYSGAIIFSLHWATFFTCSSSCKTRSRHPQGRTSSTNQCLQRLGLVSAFTHIATCMPTSPYGR